MDILMAASEAVPFCKTGGLADVAGALSQVMGRMGHRVRLFLPGYRAVEAGTPSLRAVPGQFWIPMGDESVPAGLLSADLGAVSVYFVQNSKYFSRDGLYQENGKDYADNDERFIFFSRAVLEGSKFIGFKPEVVHCHDWQTALIPAYLRTLYRIDAFYSKAACLLTIHNIAYQGVFPKDTLFLAGFGWKDFTSDRLEYYGQFSFFKAGLVFADLLTTVSPTYAAEIRNSREYGRGLEGLLQHRGKDLHGILNGIDVDVWNPESDPVLARNYGSDDCAEGKAANKARLRRDCGLRDSPDAPLLAVVSRLDHQKGLDLVLGSLPELVRAGAQLAVLGTGDPELQAAFAEAARRHPGTVYFHSSFDENFSHRVYAAADMFLMPSRFEPCGLGQMIAMRYGAVPVTTRTGGLADTVRETPEGALPPNGFVSPRCIPEDWKAALERALSAYARKPEWKSRMVHAMTGDFSWENSAARYLELYRQALNRTSA